MKKPCQSFNDMRKSEELEKSVGKNIALAALLSGPIAMKGTLFTPTSEDVARHPAGQPMIEKDDDHGGKHTVMKTTFDSKTGIKITHVSSPKPESPEDKAKSVKEKLSLIRDKIKGM